MSRPGIVAKQLETVRQMAAAFRQVTLRSFQHSEPNLIAVAICGAIGMPLYYVIWHDLFPQPYENLPLRVLGGALCLGLVFKDYWPQRLRAVLPVWWYATLLYVLPFFFTYMLLRNGSSPVWLVSTISALFLLVVIVDWLNLMIMVTVGSLAAWGAFAATTDEMTNLSSIYEQLPVFIFALIAGTIFSYRRESFKRERLDAMLSVGASVARELRSPLLGIKTSSVGLKQYLPILLQTYDKAKAENMEVPPIPPAHRRALEHVLERIQHDMGRANTIIEMLLTNTGGTRLDPEEFRVHSMSDCVDVALGRYPFTSEKESNAVKRPVAEDFGFRGIDSVMVVVLFDLIKTGLASIARAGHGEITIRLEPGQEGNRLIVRDTGAGVPASLLSRIFDEYSALEAGSGTGPGLAFAKQAVEAFGGTLSCRSEQGKYLEFTMRLPALPGQKAARRQTSEPAGLRETATASPAPGELAPGEPAPERRKTARV